MSHRPEKTPVIQASAAAPSRAAQAYMEPEAAQRLLIDRQENSLLLRVLKPLSSLKLTVVLFALSMALVLAGTLAQIDWGIHAVMVSYFRTPLAWIEPRIFFPRAWNVPRIAIPFPGGYLLGGLMLVNLIAAHTVRFKAKAAGARLGSGLLVTLAGAAFSAALLANGHHRVPLLQDFYWELLLVTIAGAVLLWGCVLVFNRRAGIVLLHGGLIFMLVSEGVTGLFALEGNLSIDEGQASNFLEHSDRVELAVIDPDDLDYHSETIIAQRLFDARAAGKDNRIADQKLPVELRVTAFHPNSAPIKAGENDPRRTDPVIHSDDPRTNEHEDLSILPAPPVSGTDPNQTVDAPAIDVSVHRKGGGEKIGDYRLSLWHYYYDQPLRIQTAGKRWDLQLRFARSYKPYVVHLLDFRHDRFLGTNVPKNFSSEVRLIDAEKGVDRTVKIWMNHPLRYAGETFFQASFKPGDRGTVLQVVQNPGRIIPYMSCIMVAFGLLWHFAAHLLGFLEKRRIA